MGHHERFDALFAVVHRKLPAAAVPGFVGSPMDDRATVTVHRALIDACDPLPAARSADDNGWMAEHLEPVRSPGGVDRADRLTG